jgi:hypothetical protein
MLLSINVKLGSNKPELQPGPEKQLPENRFLEIVTGNAADENSAGENCIKLLKSSLPI